MLQSYEKFNLHFPRFIYYQITLIPKKEFPVNFLTIPPLLDRPRFIHNELNLPAKKNYKKGNRF